MSEEIQHASRPNGVAYCLHSSREYKVNATYILMEQLPSYQLPPLERKYFDSDPEDLALVRKVYQQLKYVIFQLGMFISHLVNLHSEPILTWLTLMYSLSGIQQDRIFTRGPLWEFLRWTVCRPKWNSLSGAQSNSV